MASNCSCAAGSRLFSSWISAITAFNAWGSGPAVVLAGGVGVDGAAGAEGDGGGVDAVVEVWGVPLPPFCLDDQGEDEHPATANTAANVSQYRSGDRSMQSKTHPIRKYPHNRGLILDNYVPQCNREKWSRRTDC